jgi:DNA repair protein RadC
MTQAIVAVARPLGIAVHDHIIVGKDGHASLKGLRQGILGNFIVSGKLSD